MENEKNIKTETENEKNVLEINSVVVGMAQNPQVQIHGEAASQMIQAYKGTRYDTAGNNLGHAGRNLKKISEYKLNEKNYDSNVRQQAGFAAELVKEARDNKEAILNGSKVRTRTTDGLGETNNQIHDHKILDENGHVIKGSESQMKFIGTEIDKKTGGIKYTVIDKLTSDEWQKYDCPIDIPSDQYEGALHYADEKIAQLEKQVAALRAKGNTEELAKKEEKLRRYKEAKKKIRKANLDSQEAVDARLNPKDFVKKEVLADSHNAGKAAARSAAIMSSAISVTQNIYSVLAEDKSLEEAAEDVAKTTASSAAVAYVVGGSGTALKAVMHSSGNTAIRRLGTTNAPAMIATASVEVVKSIGRFAKGDIDELGLVQELGEKGTGMLATGFATAVGSFVAGVPGAFIGSMIGYNSGAMIYRGALATLEGAKISAERRIVIEALAESAIAEMNQYKEELKYYTSSQYKRREEVYNQLFVSMETALMHNDINSYIGAIDNFGKELGVKLSLNSREEIETFMRDPNTTFVL